MAKLTLSVDPDVVEQARELARESGTSISDMFTRLVRLLAKRRRSAHPLGPLTQAASGMIVLPKRQSDRQAMEAALLERYGLK